MHLIRIKNQKIRSGLSPAFLLLNILIIFFCHIAFANSVSQSEQIKKATQNKIHLPAESIISLAPNLTDLLVNIGAQNQLVGVSAGLEQLGLPKQVMALPKVYNISTVNLEMIVALRPDLIVLWKEGTSPLVLKTLRKLNIPLLVLSFRKLENIPEALRVLGEATGRVKAANQQADAFEKNLYFLKLKYAHKNKTPKRVFIQISQFPIFTLGSESIQSQMVAICGGRNIFSDVPRIAFSVSPSEVILKNPEVIIATPPADFSLWEKFKINMSAIRAHHECVVNPNNFSLESERMMLGLKAVCECINK